MSVSLGPTCSRRQGFDNDKKRFTLFFVFRFIQRVLDAIDYPWGLDAYLEIGNAVSTAASPVGDKIASESMESGLQISSSSFYFSNMYDDLKVLD